MRCYSDKSCLNNRTLIENQRAENEWLRAMLEICEDLDPWIVEQARLKIRESADPEQSEKARIMSDRAEEITLEIERKLCSFCCDRLYDPPKPEPCADCTNPMWFDPDQREAVVEVLRRELEK